MYHPTRQKKAAYDSFGKMLPVNKCIDDGQMGVSAPVQMYFVKNLSTYAAFTKDQSSKPQCKVVLGTFIFESLDALALSIVYTTLEPHAKK